MNPFRRKSDVVQSVVLDTSGIIDGRIVAIAQAGFVPQNVVVPQFVIAELQFLADHGDTHKRERARYGLDIIRELQDIRRIDVSISREKFEHIREVDDKLVALAKQYGAMLYTTDFNLNKVAQIEGVQVLNVNELAHALRPNLLPGEIVIIKLTQVGQDKTQGVGYLGDGTMVVVEQAGRYVGQQVQAVCTRILQTQAGKMMFAKLTGTPAPAKQTEAVRSEPRPQPAERKAVAHFPALPQLARPNPQSQQNGGVNRRRHGARNTNPAHQEQAEKQPPTPKQQPRPQGKANDARQSQPRPQKSSQSAPKPAQQPRRNGGGNRRRLSPEDSLLATLKEIEK